MSGMHIANGAAEGGHKEIVLDMIDRGADNYDDIAFAAADGGHMDIISDMIGYGVNNWEFIANRAASNGHTDIVLNMIKRGQLPIHDIIAGARFYNHISTVKTLESLNRT